MNKLVFALVLAVACSGTAVAQGFTIADDVLGAHNVNGHGCSSCHAPHSGAQGNGGTDASAGQVILWGRDFINQTYTTEFGKYVHDTTEQCRIHKPDRRQRRNR